MLVSVKEEDEEDGLSLVKKEEELSKVSRMDDLAMNITFDVSFSSSLLDKTGSVVKEKLTFVIFLSLIVSVLLSLLLLVSWP